MVIRKGNNKKRTVKKDKTKTKRKSIMTKLRKKPKIQGNVDVEFTKSKTGNHYIANIPLENKRLTIDLIGYTTEDIAKLKIKQTDGGIISVSKTDRGGDKDELIVVITDTVIHRKSSSSLKVRIEDNV
ncbi:MAG: hypothetical protein HeimC2_40270 [Candidatus Heimdallarchaeota archaeon LC_2]|nr:MAG: hypothetical protein HeimC2_40270 [Candidatus Heimdallarchaeota archaeon LC_2]